MPERIALVVDDNSTNRLLAGTILKKLGWQIVEAASGDAALPLAAAQPFSLVLLDISMPGLSGEDTCVRLREIQGERPMRIIAYTAHAYPEERAKFLDVGFDDILVKPINRLQLESMIADL